MTERMRTFFADVRASWQALVALGTAIAFGVTIGVGITSMASLPRQVAAQSNQLARYDTVHIVQRALIDQNTRTQERLLRRLDRLICILQGEAEGRSPFGCEEP